MAIGVEPFSCADFHALAQLHHRVVDSLNFSSAKRRKSRVALMKRASPESLRRVPLKTTQLILSSAANTPNPMQPVVACGRSRTLVRHARLTSALPTGLPALTVTLSACHSGLVSAAGCRQLLLPYSLPAVVAAIALPPITTRTDREKRVVRGVNADAKALGRSICCHGAGHSQPQYARNYVFR